MSRKKIPKSYYLSPKTVNTITALGEFSGVSNNTAVLETAVSRYAHELGLTNFTRLLTAARAVLDSLEPVDLARVSQQPDAFPRVGVNTAKLHDLLTSVAWFTIEEQAALAKEQDHE